MGNINRIIIGFIFGLIPFISKAQSDPDWPRFELYQLVQGQDSGIFVITDSDSNLVFTDLLKMRFFPDTALIFNGDTIAVKNIIPIIISDSLAAYVNRIELTDTALAIRNSIPLQIADSLVNYATKIQLTDTALAIRNSIPLQIADSLVNYATKIQLTDTALAIRNSIPLQIADSLVNYATKIQLTDTALAIRNSIPLQIADSLVNYATKIQLTDTALAIRNTIPLIVADTATVLRALIDTKGTVSSIATNNGVTGGTITTTGTIGLTGQALALHNLATNGLIARTGTGTVTARSIAVSGSGLSVTNGNGVSGNPTVTSNATTLSDANTLVFRDASGNFKAGVIEANLAGIAREVQSVLTPGFGLTPSDTYNGSIARTFNIDTASATLKSWVSANSATGGVTGTFVNGSVPYAATSGSALTNSGWYIDSGNLLRGTGSTTFNFDAKGTIGGTSITASAAVNGQTAAFTRGAQFNSEIGNYDFVVGGNGLATLFRVKGSTNRVGINKSTDPSYTLDVVGDVNISSGSVYRINGTALTGSQWVTTGSNIYYNSGNVGIGMTNPTSTLHVTGTITGTDDLNIDNGTFFVDASENAVGVGTSSPQFALDVVGSARIDGSTFFVSSGNDRVGIGTGTPSFKLDVKGDFQVDAAGSAFPGLVVTTNDKVGIRTDNPNAILEVEGDVLINNSAQDYDFRIEGTSDPNLFFTDASTNRVGIGVNTPSYKLDINGDVRADTYYYDVTSTLQSSSDKNLKKNIKPMNNSLEKINKLKLVEYQWNEIMYNKLQGRKSQSKLNGIFEGMIAQDVEKIFPNYVSEDADGYKTLSYVSFIVPLIKAVQEQQIQIEQLQQELKRIKKNKKIN